MRVDPFAWSARRARSAPIHGRGTRNSGSSRVFSASSDSAAASRRRSISIATERASVSTTSSGRRRARLRGERSSSRGREAHRLEVAGEALADAGPQHLDRDDALAVARSSAARDAPARSRRRRPARRTRRTRCRAGGRARPRPCEPRRPGAETAACGPAASRDRARRATPTMSGRVARNWPNLT